MNAVKGVVTSQRDSCQCRQSPFYNLDKLVPGTYSLEVVTEVVNLRSLLRKSVQFYTIIKPTAESQLKAENPYIMATGSLPWKRLVIILKGG